MFHIRTNLQFLDSNFLEIKSTNDYLNYIYAFMKLIKQKEVSRDSSIILTSYIEKMEEGCTNQKCALKKYQQSLSKGFDSNFSFITICPKTF